MESNPNYFKLLREITRYDDDKITDAQAFAFIVEELVSKKQYKNEQPLVQDNFKEKELWGEVLRLFERLSTFTGHNKMHQFDLAREEAKFLDQVEKFRNTLQKTFI